MIYDCRIKYQTPEGVFSFVLPFNSHREKEDKDLVLTKLKEWYGDAQILSLENLGETTDEWDSQRYTFHEH